MGPMSNLKKGGTSMHSELTTTVRKLLLQRDYLGIKRASRNHPSDIASA